MFSEEELLPKSKKRNLFSLGCGDWIPEATTIVDEAIREFQLELVEQVQGGMVGILILCHRDSEELILKALPPKYSRGQILALESLGSKESGLYPEIYESNPDQGTFLIEHFQGNIYDRDSPVDIPWATGAIRETIDSPLLKTETPADTLGSSQGNDFREFLSHAFRIHKGTPSELIPELVLAEQLAKEYSPSDSMKVGHLHGDFGSHNFFQTAGGLKVLDPSGVIGPIEYDAGCLASWAGGSKQKAPLVIPEIASSLSLREQQVAIWAYYRIAASANAGFYREDKKYAADRLATLPALRETYELV